MRDTKLDDTTRHAASKCPHCGHEVDASSGDGTPMPGDITLCINCAEPSIFANDLTLRLATDDERTEIDSDVETTLHLLKMQARIRRANAMN